MNDVFRFQDVAEIVTVPALEAYANNVQKVVRNEQRKKYGKAIFLIHDPNVFEKIIDEETSK